MTTVATMPMMTSTDLLKLLAENDYRLVLDRGARTKRYEDERVWIMTGDGDYGEYSLPPGSLITAALIDVPRATLDDFLEASFIVADGTEDANGRTIYRLTEDGRERGLR